MVDISNIYSLFIELFVAVLILVVDHRSRKLEQQTILKAQNMEIAARESQQLQMDRFSNWVQENSKQQLLLLESIMGALGTEEKETFTKEVSNRYKKEIRDDLEELEDLLVKRKLHKDRKSAKLDNEIDSKIDEIESANQIASSFLPANLIESLKKISVTAKSSLEKIQQMPEILDVDVNSQKDLTKEEVLQDSEVNQEDTFKEFQIEKDKLVQELEGLKTEIVQSMTETTSQIGSKLANLFSPQNIEKGIKDMLKKDKDKDKESNDQNEES